MQNFENINLKIDHRPQGELVANPRTPLLISLSLVCIMKDGDMCKYKCINRGKNDEETKFGYVKRTEQLLIEISFPKKRYKRQVVNTWH